MWKYKETEYIKLFRKITTWEWYSDPVTKIVFFHCLIKANWKPVTWHGIQLNPGEFIETNENIAKENGISVQNVKTAISHLKKSGELTCRKSGKFRIITVSNFNKYQGANRKLTSIPTTSQPATNLQLTADIRTEELKNDKEEKEIKPAAPFSDDDSEGINLWDED